MLISQYFDLLKDKQLKNSEKEAVYKHFIHERREDQLKRDESNQLRVMHEWLKLEEQKALLEKEARSKVSARLHA